MQGRWMNVGIAIGLAGLVVVGCSSTVTTGSRRDAPDGGGHHAEPAVGALGGACTPGGGCDPELYCAAGVRLCVPIPGAGGSDGNGGVSAGGFGANPNGATTGQSGSGGIFGFGGDGGAGGAAGGGGVGGCAAQAFNAPALPVDVYVMFDQSASLSEALPDNSGTWWTAAQAAVNGFVSNPRATGMGVGLQYFGLPRLAAGCTSFSTVSGDCCTPAAYEHPEIEIGVLPGNAAALTASIQAHSPASFTPTSPALQGAIDHMKTWGANHAGRAPVVVLVTDGFPTVCADETTAGVDMGAQVADIAQIAKTGFETDPKVRTFVVGFNSGQGLGNLDQIAKAGGSGKAFLIDGGNISDAFTNAMLSIAATPLQCAFDLPKPPPGQTLDITRVDVNYTPSATGVSEPIAKLNNLGDCSLNLNAGWYYDSPVTPTKILLCPGTCGKLSAGNLAVMVGCPPPHLP